MRSNFKFFIVNILLIIFFLTTKLYSVEQFNFDVAQIEITENGNKYKGLKRGKVIADNGLIIEADRFDYNKLTNIFNAFGNVKIDDQENNIVVFTNVTTREFKLYFYVLRE